MARMTTVETTIAVLINGVFKKGLIFSKAAGGVFVKNQNTHLESFRPEREILFV